MCDNYICDIERLYRQVAIDGGGNGGGDGITSTPISTVMATVSTTDNDASGENDTDDSGFQCSRPSLQLWQIAIGIVVYSFL